VFSDRFNGFLTGSVSFKAGSSVFVWFNAFLDRFCAFPSGSEHFPAGLEHIPGDSC
jgi:hypothetical protein